MTVEWAADLCREALYMMFIVSMPAMVVGMTVGLLISLLQSITSIQEQTLSFVPKLLVTLTAVVLTMAWTFSRIVEYTHRLYESILDQF